MCVRVHTYTQKEGEGEERVLKSKNRMNIDHRTKRKNDFLLFCVYVYAMHEHTQKPKDIRCFILSFSNLLI